jgi:hypothetical protein
LPSRIRLESDLSQKSAARVSDAHQKEDQGTET